MNPEEGELRPQLIDRFGLCVDITGASDPGERAEITARALDFEAAPEAFRERWASEERLLGDQIVRAREALTRVRSGPSWYRVVAELSLALEVDGHRADILMIKTATALAALADRDEIIPPTSRRPQRSYLYHPESKEPTPKKRDSWDLYTKSNNPVDYARFAQLRNQLRGLTRRLRACSNIT